MEVAAVSIPKAIAATPQGTWLLRLLNAPWLIDWRPYGNPSDADCRVFQPGLRSRTGIEGARYLGYEADWRENEDSVKRAMLILDPTQMATEDGFVTGWHVYTTRGRRSQKVFLQIWSPVKPLENRYSLVGETMIVALWVGYNYFALYPQDRIRVQRGDVLGVYFPKYNPIPWSLFPEVQSNPVASISRSTIQSRGVYFPKYNPIPWSPVDCHDGNQHLYKYNPYSVTSSLASSGPAEAGGQRASVEVTFIKGRSDWNPCRKYSLNATIMSEQEMTQYDVDYQETTDGRYERRPYGQNLSMKRASSGSTRARTSVLAGLCTFFATLLPIRSVTLAKLQPTATLAFLAIAARAISIFELTIS